MSKMIVMLNLFQHLKIKTDPETKQTNLISKLKT